MLPALALLALLNDPGAVPHAAPARSLRLPEPVKVQGPPAEIRLGGGGAAYAGGGLRPLTCAPIRASARP